MTFRGKALDKHNQETRTEAERARVKDFALPTEPDESRARDLCADLGAPQTRRKSMSEESTINTTTICYYCTTATIDTTTFTTTIGNATSTCRWVPIRPSDKLKYEAVKTILPFSWKGVKKSRVFYGISRNFRGTYDNRLELSYFAVHK